mgnify:CR=1 FL=1
MRVVVHGSRAKGTVITRLSALERKVVEAAALVVQPLHVHLGHGEPGGEAALGQQGAVLGHDVVAVEDQIGGGLPLPGVA